jgi:hypothetical protein
MTVDTLNAVSTQSSFKSPQKAPSIETLKSGVKQSQNIKVEQSADVKNNNKNISSAAVIENVNESDDDSVFINESKQKKAASANDANDVSSVICSNAAETLNAKVVSQIHNSRELNVQSETAVR